MHRLALCSGYLVTGEYVMKAQIADKKGTICNRNNIFCQSANLCFQSDFLHFKTVCIAFIHVHLQLQAHWIVFLLHPSFVLLLHVNRAVHCTFFGSDTLVWFSTAKQLRLRHACTYHNREVNLYLYRLHVSRQS